MQTDTCVEYAVPASARRKLGAAMIGDVRRLGWGNGTDTGPMSVWRVGQATTPGPTQASSSAAAVTEAADPPYSSGTL
ncbi:hypothetical protein [Streptomyces sp. NPDC012510]|uniref:hypothetical protein n=1 Tax=Streptomyces sp. NPDC012510 TaxID=3364838 RepID=UPI0036EBF952